MNSIARVMNAIHHQPITPIVRGELTLDRKFARDFLCWQTNNEVTDALSNTDLLIKCCQALKLDLVCVQSGEALDQKSDLAVDLTDIDRIHADGLFVFWVINGTFQTAMMHKGMMRLLMNIARSPIDVGEELRQRSDEMIATMARGVTAGAHGIIIADDIAHRQNTYISPDFVEQHLLPIWQTQVMAAKDLGVPVFLHSDGNLNAVLPHIVAAGFDGLQCIEPAAGMDFRQIKRKYGKDLCLMGHIDPSLLSVDCMQNDLETRYDQIRQAVSAFMASAGGNGGFIFGTCSGLHAGMAPELVHFMYHLVSELDIGAPVM